MKKPTKMISVLLFSLLLPIPALADFAKAKECADGLSPSAQAVYKGTLQAVQAGQELRTAMQSEVQSLVASGSLAQENAKGVTKAALQCMKLLKPAT